MGMVAKFHQVSPQQLSEFLRHPSSAYDYTMSPFYDNPAAIEQAEKMLDELRIKTAGFPPSVRGQVEHVAGLLRRKSSARKGPQLVTSKPKPDVTRKDFSLEKDWHVLHSALNGTHDGGTGPLADAILGGQQIPDAEGVMSFGAGSSGALRYLTAPEVRNAATALREIEPTQLLSKLDVKDAQEKRIYLAHTLENLSDWEYLPELFVSFREFYSDAADSGNAMLLSIV